jgi:hypothetical protein
MRFELLCAAACAALVTILPAQADTAQQAGMKTCAANWKTMPAGDKAKTKYNDYMSSCMKAPARPAPTMAMTPKPGAPMAMQAAGGKAKCKDGVIVSYKSRSGTCSGHKGVATWM